MEYSMPSCLRFEARQQYSSIGPWIRERGGRNRTSQPDGSAAAASLPTRTVESPPASHASKSRTKPIRVGAQRSDVGASRRRRSDRQS